MADLDGDGDLDLVTTNIDAVVDTVSVLLGNGDGSFAARSDYPTGVESPLWSPSPTTTATAGRDLATADYYDDAVSILPGNGDGSFAARTGFATGDGPHSVAAGDFDADGRLDLATANHDGNSISVLLGQGCDRGRQDGRGRVLATRR